MPRKISLRDLCRRLGLSQTTVSEALRGVPRVNLETRKRVEKAARELGYERNALVGSLMSELRRAKADSFRGTLAVLDMDGPERRSPGGDRYHGALLVGARRRAKELGFNVDTLGSKAARLSPDRLRGVVDARGVRGILFLPMASPDWTAVDLNGLASIYADYGLGGAAPNSVCPDHYRGILMAFEQLARLGYRRPGCVVQDLHDSRLLHRWEAGHHIFARHFAQKAGMQCLPIFINPYLPGVGFDGARFTEWFMQSGCDVVIAHNREVINLMEATGARVPETHGFCSLNTINSDLPCAGLNLCPTSLGERAVELLIGQVLRNEHGLPKRSLITTTPVEWVDGPTLRSLNS